MSYVKMDDQHLVNRILDGDQRAFELLIKQHQRLVAHMIGRLIDNDEDRQELSQDIFVKVYQKLGEFDFRSKLSTWIATIAYRHAINFLKKNKKWSEQEDIENIDLIAERSDGIDEKSLADYLHTYIEKLPGQYKTMLTLFHVEGMSYPEMVEITGLPEGTVKNYLFRARKKLRKMLEPVLEQESLIL
ncbi:MAG: sigma-70 family RNA polymerase sigma factor [Cyclobacteriaceae bacterium]